MTVQLEFKRKLLSVNHEAKQNYYRNFIKRPFWRTEAMENNNLAHLEVRGLLFHFMMAAAPSPS
jgi:hypothetical protein